MARDGRRPARLATAALTATLAGCIIPDAGIKVQGDFVNPGPVRIVGYTPISEAADAACESVDPSLAGCPVPPETTLGLLRTDGPFCVCDGDSVDFFRVQSFDILVEDPDVDENGEPKDALLGAFLLDVPSFAEDPSTFVAYPNLLSGTEPASGYQLGLGGYGDSIERPPPQLRSWTVGRETGFADLCNDNAAVPDGKVAPGLHSVRLVVTDRPWYQPVLRDSDGAPMLDAAEQPIRDEGAAPLIGVPDTPAGASYAIADYVFACDSAAENDACRCETP